MGKTINILLIEDNPGDVRLFREVINGIANTHYKITTSIFLQEGIQLAKENDFDIAVLDLTLPDSSGLSTLTEFKYENSGIPIIVFTGLNSDELAIIAVKSGAQDYISKGTIDSNAMGRTINYAIERHALLMALEESEKQAHTLATRDSLTGLKNRYSFNEVLVNKIYTSQRSGIPFSILFLDLDRFKGINDSLGHSAGDLLLIEVAERLTSNVRQSDIISRFGGDEFVILLADTTESTDVSKICHILIDALAVPFRINNHDFFIGCSIGIALFPSDGKTHETLIKNADAAMYSAKQAGRNCVRFYTSELNKKAFQRMSFETDLRFAVENNNFHLVYQPIFDVATKKLLGVEALVRWIKEDGTVVLPSAFINIAEETGLIVPLGKFVLHEACKQNTLWESAGLNPGFLSVNVSAMQFETNDFFSSLCDIINDTGILASNLHLELTEHVIMTDVERAILTLKLLKSINIHLAIDDFGTGYSSLNYLSQFPIDTLKIDQSFIQNMNRSEKDLALVEGIIALAKQLGLSTTAEGVETQEQLNTITSLACSRVQGFYLGKPVGPEEIELMLYKQQACNLTNENMNTNSRTEENKKVS